MAIGSRLHRAVLAALIIFLLAGCGAPKIKSLSQEVYRCPDFAINLVNHGGLALLPVIVLKQPSDLNQTGSPNVPDAPYTPPTTSLTDKEEYERRDDGRDAYRILLSKTLMSSMQTRRGSLRLVSPFDALKILNDQELTANYRTFTRDFPRVGFNQATMQRFGQALNCRYLFISQAVVSESNPEVSLTIVWTFGQRSIMRSIMVAGQIWDTETGQQVWEGSGIGYNRLHAYQYSPLDEELAQKAVDSLLDRLMN